MEKYQEQASLLDTHIRLIIQTITEKILENTNISIFTKYLNDSFIEIEEDLKQIIFIQKCFTLLYILCKVRGYKSILKYFPHEVARLEELEFLLRLFGSASVLQLNENLSQDNSEIIDPSFSTVTTTSATGQIDHFACNSKFETEPWHVEYVGGLWLSVAILAPFHLHVIDSSDSSVESIGLRLQNWCTNSIVYRFRESSPNIFSSTLLLAKLLARPDMKDNLSQFLHWSLDFLELPTNNLLDLTGNINDSASSSQKTNVLIALSAVLKFGVRQGKKLKRNGKKIRNIYSLPTAIVFLV